MRRFFFLLAALVFLSSSRMPGQSLPNFSGTWKFDAAKSKLQTPNPPSAGTVTITFDGTRWRYQRTHEYSARKPEVFSMDLKVNDAKAHVDKEGPLTFALRLARAGDSLVLHEDITASNGQKATSTVRYTLANKGQTLTEIEHKQTPSHEETNRWVFDRVVERRNR